MNKKNFLWQIIIFVFPFIIYINTLQNNFFFGDDQNIVLNNIYLRDWKYFSKFFTQNYTAGSGVLYNYWRPFQLTVYSLIVHTIGIKPWPFHLAGILFQSLCGICIFAILSKLLRSAVSSSIIAFIVLAWLAHPIANEELAGTTGIASPGYLFGMLFGALAFLFYEERGKLRWYFASLAGFVSALFFKESAVIFPGLVLGLHITAVKMGLLCRIRLRGYIYRHLVFWLIAAAYISSRLTFLNFNNTLNFYNESNLFTQHLTFRLNTMFTVLAFGLRIVFFPFGLHPERSWQVFTNFFSVSVLMPFLVLAAIVILAVLNWKRNPLFSFGAFWFFFSYLPMSNIVAKINALVWDHWFYAPSLGIFLMILSLISLARNNLLKRASFISLVLFTIIFSAITFIRNPRWRNTATFSRYILSYEPEATRVWSNLALALTEEGNDSEAIDCYLKAIRQADVYPQTHHNLANIYLKSGQYDLAEREFKRAIQIDDTFYHSYLALGRLYLSEGRLNEAKTYFRKAGQIYPYLPKEIIGLISK